MAKTEFVPLSMDIIDQWTEEAGEKALSAAETRFTRQLLPAYEKELAVMAAQEKDIAKIEAEIDVMNLASEFALRIKGGEYEKALDCFALKTAGVSAEITGVGVYEGKDALRAYYVEYLSRTTGGAGCFKMDHLSTPVVEVSEDQNTAEGTWLSIGMETYKREDLGENWTDPVCVWAYNPWHMEFVKEDGAWKIWHLTVFTDVETIYEKSWSEMAAEGGIPVDPNLPKPTRASERYRPFCPERRPLLQTEPPVPCCGKSF